MDYTGLNEAQADAVRSDAPRILCLAGAGTGKTRVLTHRIARLHEDGVDTSQMIALTFTRAAGAEMKERIISLIGEEGRDLFCNTYHAWAVRLLQRYGYKIGYKPLFTIYDEEDRTAIIDQIIEDMSYEVQTKKVLEAMNKEMLYNVPIPREMQPVIKEYQFRCRRNNAIDLDGLIAGLRQILKDDHIREEIRSQYKYIFVDEFQDTDHRQMDILDAINPENLFVVGDDFQSIYGFRGADVSIIMEMAEDPQYKVVKLEENYRSTAPIIDAANALIKHNHQTEKILRNNRKGPEIRLIEAEDPEEDMHNLVVIIRDLNDPIDPCTYPPKDTMCEPVKTIPGCAFKDIAILGRTNKQIQAASEALTMAGIPNVVCTKSADVMESQDAKMLFAWMDAILNPQDNVTIENVLNWPQATIRPLEKQKVEMFMLSTNCSLKTALDATGSAVGFLDIFSDINTVIWENYDPEETELRYELEAIDLFDYVVEGTQILEIYKEKGLTNRIQAIKEIREAILNWQERQRDIGELVSATAWLERYHMRMLETHKQEETKEDAVQIMTAHGSKGLEYEAVIIIGCNDRSFPLGKGDLEEERRLFYVAITRAKKMLYLTRSQTRITWGSKTEEAQESVFLHEMSL